MNNNGTNNNEYNSVINNKFFGIVGVGCLYSNFNADFSGNPKRYIDEYVASPFSLKFCYRYFLELKKYRVFFRIAYKFKEVVKDKIKKQKIMPMSLEEKYLSLFSLNEITNNEMDFQNNIFSAIDVINFGGVFPISGMKSSYTGAVQINTGINKYDGAETIRDVNLTQFQCSKDEKAEATTLGSRAILSEGHFFFGFTLDPNVYDHIKSYNKDFKGYTKEAYEAFKEASLCCVNSVNSVSKVGCYNEFALFVELIDGSLKTQVNLNDLVKFYKKDDKNVIDLETVMEYLNEIKKDIKGIEVYYNPITTNVKYGDKEINELVTSFNILNKKDIKE